MMLRSSVQLVKKEQVKFLKFPNEEILDLKEDQNIRLNQLKKVISSNTLNEKKVKIFFADDLGLKKVEDSIYSVTDNLVLLKDTAIPLQRIISVG